MKWNELYDGLDESDIPDYSTEINHPIYGKYIWITEQEDGWHVEYDPNQANPNSEFITLKVCKSVKSAKRWVSMNVR